MTIVFNTLGQDEAIDFCFEEASEQAEAEAEERRLKWVWDVIENHEVREQASKRGIELARHQAEMLKQGRNPAGYGDDDYDDDDYDDDDYDDDDECYPDDE